MAEGSTVCELEGLEEQLQRLLDRYPGHELRSDSEQFCSEFCKLVEEYASHWQVPLPQLRILEIALWYFARASTFFTSNCDHMLHTLSSLALSIFELLLFFDPKEFHQEPLTQFTVTFQECHLILAKYQNVHFLQVAHLVQGGGPWASPALQAILSESSLPQNEVDEHISSEPPVFFELRVHYLLSCQRISEAMALARCCAQHPTAEQHSFFLQVYLTWLYKTSQHECLFKEVADFSAKDAVQMICNLECEEKDDLLLALTTIFLSQQLRRGDMHYLCDLVLLWTRLHSRLNTNRQALFQETHRLLLSASNVNSIFPFIRAILQEVGEAGIQFCVELCANALQSCLPCDVITKTLIYKTLAVLLPNDLEVCRACALLIFFQERTVESYKMVYLLYMHPEQEYHVDCSPIGNNVRFETLQILKKDLYFDPEFWNLIALRTNCLKLLRDRVVNAALEEIMEDKWISSYCTKGSAARSACHKGRRRALQQHHKQEAVVSSKRLNLGPGKTRLNSTGARRGHRGLRPLKEVSSQPLRRSFWQLDRVQDNGELRRTTRLSEKTQEKRRIRTPRWLLEDSGTLEENNGPLKMKKRGLRHRKHHRSSVMTRSDPHQFQYQLSVNSELKVEENSIKYRKAFSLDYPKPSPTPQVILELSLPDNELIGTFTDDACSRQRGLPQVLLYKPTVKLPETSQPIKPVHGKEVILRARDTTMLVQQLHCYTRKQKGKGNAPNAHGSVSTITRSSVQGSLTKHPRKELTCGGKAPRITAKDREPHRGPIARGASQKVSQVKALCGSSTSKEPCEEPAVEMKVTIASQSAVLDKVPKDASKVESFQTPTVEKKVDAIPPISQKVETNATDKENDKVAPQDKEDKLMSVSSQTESCKKSRAAENISEMDAGKSSERESKAAWESRKDASLTPAEQNHIDNISTLTLVTEMVSELAPEQLAQNLDDDRRRAPANCASKELKGESKSDMQHNIQATSSSSSVSEKEASTVVEKEKTKGSTHDFQGEMQEDSEPDEMAPESEESKLEFGCTFCNKMFKGSRVVAHAMFHYRKDECMFCRVTFKDDLLAMMHLSDHIEKLKRIKDIAGSRGKSLSDTKETATSKTCAKVRTADSSSERRGRGRPRKSTASTKSVVPSESKSSGSRMLRSSQPMDGPPSHAKQSTRKHLITKTAVHRLNGHTNMKDLKRLRKYSTAEHVILLHKRRDAAANQKLREKQRAEVHLSATSPQVAKKSSSSSSNEKRNAKSTQVEKIQTEHNRNVDEKNMASQEKLCCPLDGCSWFTDVSKNRVSILYHALQEHHGEIKPLKLAFRVGNGKCSICMRVLWSFEHFQHHVERHRLTPRFPCLHRGCTARFKTGNEMRRHTRKHSPLQAECCLPGCSKLFICLWALNLHEREHYVSKSAAPVKHTNVKLADGQKNATVEKKKSDSSSEDADAPFITPARKLREEDVRDSKERRQAARLSLTKERSETENKNSNVLKNLSNKNTSAQPCGPNLRLRQTLRKATNAAVLSSSLLKNRKLRHNLRSKLIPANTQGKRKRGRPRKVSIELHDENTTVSQNKKATDDKTNKNQKSPAPLPVTKTAQNKTKEEGTSQKIQEDDTKSEERSHEETKVKKSPGRPVKRCNLKHRLASHKVSSSNNLKLPSTASDLKVKTISKFTIKKRLRSNSHKMKHRKVNKEPEKKHPKRRISIRSAVKKPAKRKSSSPSGEEDEVGKTKMDKTDLTQNVSGKSNRADSLTAPLPTKRIQSKSISKDESKKSAHKEEKKKSVNKNHEDKKEKLKKIPPPQKERQHQDKAERGGAVLLETLAKDRGEERISVSSEPREAPTPPANPVENITKKAKPVQLKASKNSHTSTESKKRKVSDTDDKDIVKKQRKSQSEPSAPKTPPNSDTPVRPMDEPKAEAGTPASLPSGPGYSSLMHHGIDANTNSSLCIDTLKTYSKKPHLRVPPSVYLDEKFTAMPKKRKDAFFFSPEPARETAATPQRQRCANCFTSFNSAEELQGHLQQHKCSKLFGFDSDDED